MQFLYGKCYVMYNKTEKSMPLEMKSLYQGLKVFKEYPTYLNW